MTLSLKTFVTLAVLLSVVTACNKSDDGLPTGPSPGGGGTCRELASDFTAQTAAGGFTATTTSTCAFTTSSLQVTCTHRYTDSVGGSTTTTSVTVYGSVADLVDEIAVLPPRTYAVRTSATQTGTSSGSTSATFSFDGSRRLTTVSGTSAAGAATTTYTAWDSSGRPSTGTDVGPGFSNALTISYDNAARTRTTNFVGGLVTTVEAFDANGNPASQATVGGASVSTTVYTTRATQRICK